MHSVLIVEDELLVRMGIKISVDWAAYNMIVLADVADGLAAFQAFRQLKPDIVITDIRMPGMDGIELIRKIREEDQNCRILVISCLDDFRTLQSIMGYQISGYLLKATMTEVEISRNLNKVKQELERVCQPQTTVEDPGLLSNLEDICDKTVVGDERKKLEMIDWTGMPARMAESSIVPGRYHDLGLAEQQLRFVNKIIN